MTVVGRRFRQSPSDTGKVIGEHPSSWVSGGGQEEGLIVDYTSCVLENLARWVRSIQVC